VGGVRPGDDAPPPGALEADAYLMNLDPLATCLSCTSAHAGPDSSGAEGREARLAGESVSEGQVPANGYANGAAVFLPGDSRVRAGVAEWDGSTTEGRERSNGHARGALLDTAVYGGDVAAGTIGESRSDASYSGSASHARSESNGARIDLLGGALGLVVLHSDGSSDAPGHEYPAAVNGVQFLSSNRRGELDGVTVEREMSVALLRSDQSGGLVAMVSDGRAQRIAGVGSTWVGNPSADPEPLR